MDERRHLWVALVLLGGGALLGTTAMTGLQGPSRVGYLLAAPTLAVLGLLVANRRLTARTGIAAALVAGIIVFVTRLAALPALEAADNSALGYFAFRGIVLLSGAAFIALGPVRGLAISTLTWVAGVGILLLGPMPIGPQSTLGQGVLGVALSSAIAIVMFRLLSSSVVQARVQAEVAQSSAELAFVDELTGMPNRRQMMVHLGAATTRAAEGGGPDTLMMFDLDRFKEINDTLGHEAGDEVLRRTATVASSTLRDRDLLCRWGGEEFLVLLSDADEAEAGMVAERCRRELEAIHGPTAVTASFGVTRVDSADTIADAVRRADLALYEAKRLGRNQIVVRRAGDPV